MLGLSEAPVARAVRAPAQVVPGARTVEPAASAQDRSYMVPGAVSEKEMRPRASVSE